MEHYKWDREDRACIPVIVIDLCLDRCTLTVGKGLVPSRRGRG